MIFPKSAAVKIYWSAVADRLLLSGDCHTPFEIQMVPVNRLVYGQLHNL